LEGDAEFYPRYVYDLVFYLLVNVILMNVLFGTVIDSFAD
jgi:hypothetical protein